MKSQAYERRNLEGFEGDTIMHDTIKDLIKRWHIDLVVETGTYLGGTTRKFAQMCKEVVTIEINQAFFMRAQNTLKNIPNVQMILGDSVVELPKVIHQHKGKGILFWLDDHWYDNIPLLAELEIIAESGISCLIAIHDFKVPDHPELGFDSYGKVVFDWDYIKEGVEKIYGDRYEIRYNEKAVGAKRGLIIITPV